MFKCFFCSSYQNNLTKCFKDKELTITRMDLFEFLIFFRKYTVFSVLVIDLTTVYKSLPLKMLQLIYINYVTRIILWIVV